MRTAASRVVAGALALAALWLGACGGGRDSDPSPSPTLSTPKPAADATPAPTPPGPETAFRLVYREPGGAEDIIWRVNPSDLSQKEKIGIIPHAPSCYSTSSVSPDGRFLSYIAQPPETACEPSLSKAEAFIFDFKLGETVRVAQGVDLRFRPLWTADSRLAYFRRYAGAEILGSTVSILRIAVVRKPLPGEPTATPTPTPDPNVTPEPTLPPGVTPSPTPEPGVMVMSETFARTNAFIPLGFADGGRSLLFIQLPGGTGGATLLGEYAPASVESIAEEKAKADAAATPAGQTPDPAAAPTPSPTPNAKLLVTLSDQTARDFTLSADSAKLSFTVQGLVEGAFIERAYWVDIPARTVSQIPMDGLPNADQFSPVWYPVGARVAVGLPPVGIEAGAIALVPWGGGAPSFLWPADSGYDVPLLWAPDGTYLAVRHFAGDLSNPGAARLDLVAPTGQRVTVAEGADVEVVGWFPPEPPPEE